MESLSKDEFLSTVKFDSKGLVPVIAQEKDSHAVLMLAYMNKQALIETLETKRMCYFSRSRQSLWRKGETSGHVQHVKEIYIDCDGDTILAIIEQTGSACHTGNHSCFYRDLKHADF